MGQQRPWRRPDRAGRLGAVRRGVTGTGLRRRHSLSSRGSPISRSPLSAKSWGSWVCWPLPRCTCSCAGFRAALRAGNDYTFFLATAVTLFLTVPVLLVMAAGMLGAIPLTGVVTPFLSYGGSAMLANFTALGILSVVGRDETGDSDDAVSQPFVTWHRLWALLDSR